MNHSHPKPSLPIASHSAIQGRPAVHPQVAERLANTLGCIQREADADPRMAVFAEFYPIALGAATYSSRGCTACPLHASRYDTVPGEGDPQARLAFIGEAPGKEEDATGRPFVGQAGKLLTEMIGAMGLTRQQVFITNTVRCRPPMNRKPERDELEACSGYLWATLQALPNLSHIVLLGATAAQSLLANPLLKITQERGKWRDLIIPSATDPHRVVNLMPTFHPSYLLRSPWEKPKAWADLQMVVQALAESRPQTKEPTI